MVSPARNTLRYRRGPVTKEEKEEELEIREDLIGDLKVNRKAKVRSTYGSSVESLGRGELKID